MIFKTENDLISFGQQYGEQLAKQLQASSKPLVIELIGDVGTGKTTFTRGLAQGLGIQETVTSPSFTICKRYSFPLKNSKTISGTLSHYDFYRLDEPGLMSEDLAETISEKNSVVVIEWGETVADVLPEERTVFHFTLNDDESRTVEKK